MIIRRAKLEDAPQICAIRSKIMAHPTITFTTVMPVATSIANEMAATENTERPQLVAIIDDQVAGYAFYKPFRSGPVYARTVEHTIHLADQYKGQGVGTKLMHSLMGQARHAGVRIMVAGISAQNRTALTFHSRIGFVESGRLPNVGFKNGKYLDLVLMQADLSTDIL